MFSAARCFLTAIAARTCAAGEKASKSPGEHQNGVIRGHLDVLADCSVGRRVPKESLSDARLDPPGRAARVAA